MCTAHRARVRSETLGSTGAYHDPSARARVRTRRGPVETGDATCALEDCVIEWSSNVGVLAHVGKSEATVSNCTLRHNFIASGVDDASTLSLCACSRADVCSFCL